MPYTVASRTQALLLAALTTAALAVAGTLAPPARAADTTPPVLASSVSLAPATVDVTSGSGTAAIALRLTDATGVDDATLTLTNADGVTSTDVGLERTAGTPADGTWSGEVSFTAFDPAGAWRPSALVAHDRDGNTATITTGLGAGLTVTSTPDTVAPVLTGVTTDVTAVSTTSGPADVPLTVTATDDLAGVTSGEFVFTSPDGDTVSGYLDAAGLVSGTARNGTWRVAVTFPARSAAGTWTLTSASLGDGQFNTAFVDGVPALTIEVSAAADTVAPALTSFRVGPAQFSRGYLPEGYVYARVGFTDDVSGLADVQVTLRRPDGTLEDAEPSVQTWADADARTGTSTTGTLTVPVFGEFPVTGTWSVASVVLTDLAGNVTTVATAGLGSGAKFVVTSGKTDSRAPAATSYAFSPASLDTRAGEQDGTLLLGVTDAETGTATASGFDHGTFTLTSPSGTQQVDGTISTADLADGDPVTGVVRGHFTLDANSVDGDWRLSALSLTDLADRTRTYTSAELAGTPALAVVGRSGPARTAPGAPTIGRATLTGTTASVTWTPPASTGGTPITGYVVTPFADGSTGTPVSVAGSATTASVPGLGRGRSYTFTVTAVNAIGSSPASLPSNAVAVPAVAPGVPAIGAASPDPTDDTAAVVTWSRPDSDGGAPVTGYAVTPYSRGVAGTPVVVGDVTTATIRDLARGRAYSFRVAAVNRAGTGTASPASNEVAIAATVPAAPTRVSAVASGGSTTVSWSAPDDGGAAITSYRVTGSPAGSCTTTGTSCVVGGLTPGVLHTFTVAATNAVGTGAESAPGTARAATELALGRTPSSVAYGTRITVGGRLMSSSTPVAGVPVSLQYRRTGSTGAWSTLAGAVSSDAGGYVHIPIRPGYSVQVRLVATGTAAYAPATSAARTLAVTRALSLAASRSSAKRGSAVALSGTGSPAIGRTVYLQRWSNHAWRTVARSYVRGTAYRFTVRPSTRGTASYRVVVTADSRFVTSVSPTRHVRVK